MSIFSTDKEGFLVGEKLMLESNGLLDLIERNTAQLVRMQRTSNAASRGREVAKPSRNSVNPGAARASRSLGIVGPYSGPVAKPSPSRSSNVLTTQGKSAESNREASPEVLKVGLGQASTRRISKAIGEQLSEGGKRDSSGRFIAGSGRSGSESENSGTFLGKIAEVFGNLSARIGGAGSVENLDPTLKAAMEVKDMIAPIGLVAKPLARGFGLLKKKEESKQTGLLSKILEALRGTKRDSRNSRGQSFVDRVRRGFTGAAESASDLIPNGVLAGGAGGIATGLLSRSASLAKGFAKRIPLLGTLVEAGLSAYDYMKADSDQTLSDSERRQKKGGAIGRGAGAVSGALLGAKIGLLGGPIASAVGAVVGGIAGSFFGEDLGKQVAEPAVKAYQSMVDSTSNAMEEFSKWSKDSWDKGIEKFNVVWDSAKQTVEEKFDAIKVVFDQIGEFIKAIPGFKTISSGASTATNFVKEKAAKAVDGVASVFGMGTQDRAIATAKSYAAGNIGGLDDKATRALVASTVATESGGGKLDVINKQGYMGRYQAGAGWLADAGLINGGSNAVKSAMKADGHTSEWKWAEAGGMTRFLDNPANWSAGMSKDKYLASAGIQDAAFKTNSDSAYAQLKKSGVINDGTPPMEVAGLLKARHLSGIGGATQVANGGSGPADANGTTARKYFNDLAVGGAKLAENFATPSPQASVTTALAGVSSPSSVAMAQIPTAPSMPTAKAMPNVDVVMPTQSLSRVNDQSQQKVISAAPVEKAGRELQDRRIAHIVTGGISTL